MRRVEDADWKRILRIVDEAFADYLTGMATLRERVVVDLKRKLSDSKVLDHRREGSTPRSAPGPRGDRERWRGGDATRRCAADTRQTPRRGRMPRSCRVRARQVAGLPRPLTLPGNTAVKHCAA